MYSSTRGIVFRLTKYSDTSLIVTIFTEEFGIRSYLVKGARSPKSKLKASLFQPLTLLDLVVSHHGKGELHYIQEARIAFLFRSIPIDINKSSVMLFLNELLYKSIREEEAYPELFQFIYDQMVYLDEMDQVSGIYHVIFALHLTRFLGFYPQGNPGFPDSVFDLQEGHFTRQGQSASIDIISGTECTYFEQLLALDPKDHLSFFIPGLIRNALLEKILLYYKLHLPISGGFKSHLVLHEVLKK